MLSAKLTVSVVTFVLMFGTTFGAGVVLFLWVSRDQKRAINRLRNLGNDSPAAAQESRFGRLADNLLPKLGSWLFPKEGYLAGVRKQLVQAGFYRSNGAEIFLGIKLGLMLVMPLLAAVIPFLLNDVSLVLATAISVSAVAVGMLMPNLWLESQVRKRHRELRQALPDALDMLVLCLEGGISMTAAFQRVVEEVQEVHPVLREELRIVQQEIQLGLSTGEGLQKMGQRCGTEEIRDLASVLLQSERYGVSLVKALRMHADSWRQERQHQMEALAQKTAVKILFPTLLCIFPAIFIVLLGPAAFQMAALFAK